MSVHVSLTPELERWVREKVERGLYNNVSEVVRAALRLLMERDRLRDARIEQKRQGRPSESGEMGPGDRSDLGALPLLEEFLSEIERLSGGEHRAPAGKGELSDRLREALELLRFSSALMEHNVRREHPDASDAEIEERLAAREREADWGEVTPGYLERSPERLEKLVRDAD